jgi:hypothetical protein
MAYCAHSDAGKVKLQNIGVQSEDEFGGVIADFDPRGIDLRIVTAAPSSTGCLRFIDPYGNFLANQRQLPILIAELEDIRRSTQDPEFKVRWRLMQRHGLGARAPRLGSCRSRISCTELTITWCTGSRRRLAAHARAR